MQKYPPPTALLAQPQTVEQRVNAARAQLRNRQYVEFVISLGQAFTVGTVKSDMFATVPAEVMDQQFVASIPLILHVHFTAVLAQPNWVHDNLSPFVMALHIEQKNRGHDMNQGDFTTQTLLHYGLYSIFAEYLKLIFLAHPNAFGEAATLSNKRIAFDVRNNSL